MTAPQLAAGAVCWKVTRKGNVKILVVHRPQHRDVSLPKGKVEPGETLPETAVREIAEETGLLVALGAPLGIVQYELPNGRPKRVYYWAAEVHPDALANSTFVANDEIEELQWMKVDKARRKLSYPHDVDIVDRFAELAAQDRARTFAVVVLRHGKATPHEEWRKSDASRPLVKRGVDQAISVSPGVAAFRPGRLVSSPAVRCMSTIQPIARLTGLDVVEQPAISQDDYQLDGQAVADVVGEVIASRTTTVLCSHNPVLPQLIAAIVRHSGAPADLDLSRAASLGTGEFAVLHVPVADPSTGIVAVEVHAPAL